MTDEEVIKRRLLIDGDGTGDDRRLNSLIKGIIKWSNSIELTQEENEQMHDRLIAQLAQCEFPANRALIVSESNQRQLDDYEKMEEEIEQNIIKVKETIEEKKAKLEEAKILKGHRMQYDLLAKNIQEQPARSVTEETLSTLRIELDNLKEELRSYEDLMDKRRKQFGVLSSSANQIKALLEQEKKEETINTSLDDITNSPGPEPMSE